MHVIIICKKHVLFHSLLNFNLRLSYREREKERERENIYTHKARILCFFKLACPVLKLEL